MAEEPEGRGPRATIWRRCSQARLESKRGAAAVACSSTSARTRAARLTLLSLLLGDVIAGVVAGVDLARPGNLLVRVDQHLLPLRQPAGNARDREQHREHLAREPHRLVDEPRVEVDV